MDALLEANRLIASGRTTLEELLRIGVDVWNTSNKEEGITTPSIVVSLRTNGSSVAEHNDPKGRKFAVILNPTDTKILHYIHDQILYYNPSNQDRASSYKVTCADIHQQFLSDMPGFDPYRVYRAISRIRRAIGDPFGRILVGGKGAGGYYITDPALFDFRGF